MKQTAKLPTPDPIAQQHSDTLLQQIIQTIEQRNNWLSFADFMQMALYQTGLGYYSNGLTKIGIGGDFVTAPQLSPLFSMALGNHIADVLQQIPGSNCLEFGAGNGQMAVDLLLYLDSIDCLPTHYYIVEASAYFREIQKQTLAKESAHLKDKVVWLDRLPATFSGVIIANEVCDAMPVHRVQFGKELFFEQGISVANNQLQWQLQPLSNPQLAACCDNIRAYIEYVPYLTEINLQVSAWLTTVGEMLTQGAILLIDYGFSATEYYHPQRHQGTLRCHYQQQVHDDPLRLIGLQDITAHVNFTALAESALAAGLHVAGFQRQADFLLAGGILELSQSAENETYQQLQNAAALKRLLLPDQMGEVFKVLSLAKEVTMQRSVVGDLRHRL